MQQAGYTLLQFLFTDCLLLTAVGYKQPQCHTPITDYFVFLHHSWGNRPVSTTILVGLCPVYGTKIASVSKQATEFEQQKGLEICSKPWLWC
jgi:hypothetical protein